MLPGIVKILDEFYPDDLPDYMNDRVYISLSIVDSMLPTKWTNVLKSQFANRKVKGIKLNKLD